MKDSLQNGDRSRRTESDRPARRVVDDVDAMRALAHPDRLAILGYLLAARTRTATECAAEVGISASACSYHLRELERFGFAERAETDGDQRTRPWRAAAVGFAVGQYDPDASAASRAVADALGRVELAENQRLVERYVLNADRLDPRWQAAADFHTFELSVTPEELAELNEEVATVLRRFAAPTRERVPDDAAEVHVVYQAFPRLPAT